MINLHEGSEPGRFQSKHVVQSRTADNEYLYTITGIVVVDMKGMGPAWRRDRVYLSILFPGAVPAGRRLRILQWATLITPSAIANDYAAENAGWAVDSFGGPDGTLYVSPGGYFTLWADVAVRDIDGWLYRLAYSTTLKFQLG